MNILEKLCKLYLERNNNKEHEKQGFVALNGFKVITSLQYNIIQDYLYKKTKKIFSGKIGRYYGCKFIKSDAKKGVI